MIEIIGKYCGKLLCHITLISINERLNLDLRVKCLESCFTSLHAMYYTKSRANCYFWVFNAHFQERSQFNYPSDYT